MNSGVYTLAAILLVFAIAFPAAADTAIPDEVIVRYADNAHRAYSADGVRRWVDRRTAVLAVPRDAYGRRSPVQWRAFEQRLQRRAGVL